VRVFLKEATAGRGGGGGGEQPGASQFYFTVGSIDSFERRLEQAQYDLGLDQKDFVPVLYANETSWGGEVLKFAPTILIIAVWLYVMRQMCAPPPFLYLLDTFRPAPRTSWTRLVP
jgi:hypothetical protein